MKVFKRREFIQTLVLGLSGISLVSCERQKYIRPEADLDLGPVKSLLYVKTHVPIKSVLVFRDPDGWHALSTRCTYDGCDLTYQEPVLLCPCCRTRYTMDGVPYQGGKARRNLPWVELSYRDGHLHSNPGKFKNLNWRFTSPEIEEAIRKLRKNVKEEDLDDEVTIPKLLEGKKKEPGMMFLEDDPNMIHELDMIR